MEGRGVDALMQDCASSRRVEQFVSRNSRCTPSVNVFKRHLESVRDSRRWVVTSRTLSPHKPFWLLVHARYESTFVLRYVTIAAGADTPGQANDNQLTTTLGCRRRRRTDNPAASNVQTGNLRTDGHDRLRNTFLATGFPLKRHDKNHDFFATFKDL